MNDDRSDLTIACSLEIAELGDRRDLWGRLAKRALRETRSTTAGVQLVYAGSEETERELRQLVGLEAQCCSFADWRVTRSGGDVLLDVTSAGDGVTAVRSLFGLV